MTAEYVPPPELFMGWAFEKQGVTETGARELKIMPLFIRFSKLQL